MRIVTAVRLILYVRRVDRNTALALFGRLVDIRVVRRLRTTGFGQYLRNRRRQRRLTMVNVTNRANVAVRLVTYKILFRHLSSPTLKQRYARFARTSSATA